MSFDVSRRGGQKGIGNEMHLQYAIRKSERTIDSVQLFVEMCAPTDATHATNLLPAMPATTVFVYVGCAGYPTYANEREYAFDFVFNLGNNEMKNENVQYLRGNYLFSIPTMRTVWNRSMYNSPEAVRQLDRVA